MIIGIILIIMGMNVTGTVGLVLIGLGIMSIVSSVSISVETTNKSKSNEPCKLHTWTYDKDEKLFCSTCTKYTHQISSEYDKPY